jgi:hypothetical protein
VGDQQLTLTTGEVDDMATGNSKAGKVEHHPLVQALNPKPEEPPKQTVKLLGLPGASTSADHTRLWLDGELTSYVDVPDAAILHSKTLPDEAGTVLWVAADAQLSHGSVGSHAAQAGFLSGSIAGAHLAGATATGAGGTPPIAQTPPVTLFPPCHTIFPPCPPHTIFPPCPPHTIFPPCVHNYPSLPFCRTETCPPSHLGPCYSQLPGCHLLSEIRVCWPSHAMPCHVTVTPPCPTQPVVCTPSHVIPCNVTHAPPCPVTHTAPCQSVQLICPTPTAVLHCQSFSCPTRVCPSTATPCQTGEACPTALCPPQSIACGGPGGGFGQAA